MHTTPVTLLHRLKEPDAGRAWERFVEVYAPLIYAWACKVRRDGEEPADMVQEAFVLLVRKLPEFTYDPGRSFRNWLCTVTLNCCAPAAAASRPGPRPRRAGRTTSRSPTRRNWRRTRSTATTSPTAPCG